MLIIFRKGPVARPTNATVATWERVHGAVCRKPRTAFDLAFLPVGRGGSPFGTLPLVPAKVVRNMAALLVLGPDHSDYSDPAPAGRTWADCGLIVPDEAGIVNSPENVRLYVKNNLALLVDPASVAVVEFP